MMKAIALVALLFLQPTLVGPTFDVASIKRNRSLSDFAEGGFQPGGRINARNVTLVNLMIAAYATTKIDGGPAWANADRFDVAATGNRDASVGETRQMLRALLVDRFKLVTRAEMRDEPIFELTATRPHVAPTSPPCPVTDRDSERPSGPPDIAHPPCGRITFGGGVFRGHGVTVDQLADVLSAPTGRVVRNRTGLDGHYDFELRFSPQRENPNPADPPVIFTAIREQLGLELKATRGPVEYLVIVSAQPPQLDE